MAKPAAPAPASSLDDVDRTVAARIHEGRLKRRLTLDELGARIGVSAQQVQKYELGASRLSAGRLKALADALELDPAWFFPRPPVASERLSPDDIAQLEQLKAVRPDVFEAFRRLIETSL